MSVYKKYLRVLANWPTDPSRGKRDLGSFIRKKVAEAFPKGETSRVSDPKKCEAMYVSLHRLSTDHYKKMYERSVENKGMTGMTKAQISNMLSDRGIEELAQKNKGIFRKIWDFSTSFFRKKK